MFPRYAVEYFDPRARRHCMTTTFARHFDRREDAEAEAERLRKQDPAGHYSVAELPPGGSSR